MKKMNFEIKSYQILNNKYFLDESMLLGNL